MFDQLILVSEKGYARFLSLEWFQLGGIGDGIRLGISSAPIGVISSIVAILVTVLVIISRQFTVNRRGLCQLCGSAVVSLVGGIVVLLSASPWSAFFGFAIMAIGSSLDGTRVVGRFLLERVCGILLMIFGQCVWSTVGISQGWELSSNLGAIPGLIGAGLIVMGAFLQLQAFPILGWHLLPMPGGLFEKIFFPQIFSGLVVFSVLARFSPAFEVFGLSWVIGCCAGVSGAFSAISGAFQVELKAKLSLWVAASYAAAVGALFFSGLFAGLSIALGVAVSTSTILCFLSLFDGVEASSSVAGSVARKRAVIVGFFLALVSAVGGPGFAAFRGFIDVYSSVFESPLLMGVFVFTTAMISVLGWNIVINSIREEKISHASWGGIIVSYLLIVLSCGLAWLAYDTGSGLGGGPIKWGVAWPHFGLIVVSFGIAHWSFAIRHGAAARFIVAHKTMATFFGAGYGIDSLLSRSFSALLWFTDKIETTIGRWLIMDLVQKWMRKRFSWIAPAISIVDTWTSVALSMALRRAIMVPAKATQLIQNGNPQWYIIFPIGVVIAVLIHFLGLH